MRFLISMLIIILLPFILGFTGFSYGSMDTESNLNTRMMETAESSPSISSNVQLDRLKLKERVMTPGINFPDDEGVVEILEDPETPLSPAYIPVDFHFTEDIRLEKNYIRSLTEMKLNTESDFRNEIE